MIKHPKLAVGTIHVFFREYHCIAWSVKAELGQQVTVNMDVLSIYQSVIYIYILYALKFLDFTMITGLAIVFIHVFLYLFLIGYC